jgi:hypothetical protein
VSVTAKIEHIQKVVRVSWCKNKTNNFSIYSVSVPSHVAPTEKERKKKQDKKRKGLLKEEKERSDQFEWVRQSYADAISKSIHSLINDPLDKETMLSSVLDMLTRY